MCILDQAVQQKKCVLCITEYVCLPSGVMPKRGLEVNSCEVFRFYKLVTIKSLIEPLSMIVPRRVSAYPVTQTPEHISILELIKPFRKV